MRPVLVALPAVLALLAPAPGSAQSIQSFGAGIGAALGALAACAGPDRTECADGPILIGALGAGVGLAASALDHRATTVYRRPMDVAPAAGSTRPRGPFDDLALRVNLDDRVRVEDASGVKITGRLRRLTGDELTIETAAGEKDFSSARVRGVAARSHALGAGALVGAGVFAVLAAATTTCRSNPHCRPLAAGVVGAGVGLAVGALIPRMTTVYRAREEHAPRVADGACEVGRAC